MAEGTPVATSGRIQDTWDGTPGPLAEADLQRYLGHVGVARPPAPTLSALTELTLAHLRAIPFENLDPMLGRPVSLEPAALLRKLCSGTRGGYCFEHNMLFAAALAALGFRGTQLLAGRALIGLEPGEVRPRTHLGLLVTTQDAGARLVDVGFGRTTLNGPLRPEPGLEQELAGDRYRLLDVRGEWELQASRRGEGPWIAQYMLDPRPVYPVDVEMANHFVATHPRSHMRRSLILLRPSAAGKRSVAGGHLVIDEGERLEERDLAPGELGGVLRELFGIEPPEPVGRLLG